MVDDKGILVFTLASDLWGSVATWVQISLLLSFQLPKRTGLDKCYGQWALYGSLRFRSGSDFKVRTAMGTENRRNKHVRRQEEAKGNMELTDLQGSERGQEPFQKKPGEKRKAKFCLASHCLQSVVSKGILKGWTSSTEGKLKQRNWLLLF